MIKVLFVCAGNICRSPMIEAVFRDLVEKAGLADQFYIDSAGTGGWHVGEPAHLNTLAILRREGIPYDGRARQVTRQDLETFDYILAMDNENLNGLKRIAPSPMPDILMFLADALFQGSVDEVEVPDPYYNGKYEIVYELAKVGSAALLQRIRSERRI